MFDIGWSELVVIGIVALIAIGPRELPAVLRTMGQWISKVRRMASDFQGQFQEAMREAEMADLKKQVEDINQQASSFASGFDPVASANEEIQKAIDGTPATEAAAEQAAPQVAVEHAPGHAAADPAVASTTPAEAPDASTSKGAQPE